MRKLKLDDKALTQMLDELDVQEAEKCGLSGKAQPDRFSYRVRALRVDVQVARDQFDTHIVPSRRLGRDGIQVLVGNLLHAGCACKVHLITVRNNWQTVSGVVDHCRYIQGSACVHEIFIKFDRPVDPASFAPTAIRTKILLADDSKMSRRLISHLLETMNVDLTQVTNGIEAVQAALQTAYDLILMDIEMPELDGLSAVKLLRNKGYIRPIVAVSGMSDPEDRDRCLMSGCDDFIAKPPQRECLATVVNQTKPEPLVSSLLHEPDMVPLIDAFVQGLPALVTEMQEHFGTRSWEKLAGTARTLKGEAGGFGFEPITEAAIDVERAIRQEMGAPEVRVRLSTLARYCLAARPADSGKRLEEEEEAKKEEEARKAQAEEAADASEKEEPASASTPPASG